MPLLESNSHQQTISLRPSTSKAFPHLTLQFLDTKNLADYPTMSLQSPESTSFPFLSLPSEIRNMIYHYLFHQPTPITFIRYRNREPCHELRLPINLLLTNNQIHLEACSVLYRQNTLIMDYSYYHNKLWPIWRTDIDTPNSAKLRSGRVISCSRYEGRVYAHVLHRFRTLGLTIPWYNYSGVDNHQGIYIAKALNALCSSPLVSTTTTESTEAPRSLPLLDSVPANSTSQCKFFVIKLLFGYRSSLAYPSYLFTNAVH